MKISPNHPRFRSLQTREQLVRGFQNGIVATQGLIAHGRGEAFDYLFGEITPKSSRLSTEAAAAFLLSARNPVISINGNTAALVPRDIVKLANLVPAGLEVNLFHRSLVRERRIDSLLRRNGAKQVLGVNARPRIRIRGVASARRSVDAAGIGDADVVLIPLEDGDRAEALRKAGKAVIAIDLNPMSRTSRAASVTIVDNIIRAIPELLRITLRMKPLSKSRLNKMSSKFDNEENLARAMKDLIHYMQGWA
ncbi:MAG TPA: phosphopantothenate/pantothenate synthetase [Candidatus Bathyarchaeia archaeon]|nr:phosphopantothenate/pantothenate synthetase [Candidatus Bathyarchaeia archaeon]